MTRNSEPICNRNILSTNHHVYSRSMYSDETDCGTGTTLQERESGNHEEPLICMHCRGSGICESYYPVCGEFCNEWQERRRFMRVLSRGQLKTADSNGRGIMKPMCCGMCGNTDDYEIMENKEFVKAYNQIDDYDQQMINNFEKRFGIPLNPIISDEEYATVCEQGEPCFNWFEQNPKEPNESCWFVFVCNPCLKRYKLHLDMWRKCGCSECIQNILQTPFTHVPPIYVEQADNSNGEWSLYEVRIQ